MKKSTILAIFALVAILGIGIIIKLSQQEDTVKPVENTNKTKTEYCSNINQKGLDLEKDNTASEIGEGEIKLNCENFKAEVENYKGIVLVDMYSPTCPHCQKIGPTISEVAKETKGKYKIGKLNVYAYNVIGGNYNIESVPALIFFKDGKEVKRLVGEQSKETIIKTLKEIEN